MSEAARNLGSSGLLGDTPGRDYAAKLERFSAFAEPELRAAIASYKLKPGMRVLDAGCGTGEALHWLWGEVAPTGAVLGVELAAAHVKAARRHLKAPIEILEGDFENAPLDESGFDFIWCVNTLHHLRDPARGLRRLTGLLKPGGRIVVGQSSFLPDMYFAWDSRLERAANDAVRRYYRDRYALDESDLSDVRSLLGRMRSSALRNVGVRTVMIERSAPLKPADRAYLLEAIFRETWGERLKPYLAPQDYEALSRQCDPAHAEFALGRPDFHFLQTLSFAVGEL